MSDARDLLVRYLTQREKAGESPIVLDGGRDLLQRLHRLGTPTARGEGTGDAPDREAATGSRKAERVGVTPRSARSARGDEGPRPRRQGPPQPMTQRTTAATRSSDRAGGAKGGWQRSAPAVPPQGIVIAPPSSDLFSGDPFAQCDLGEIAALVRDCRRCGLCQGRTNAVPGEGPPDARLVVVGEGPGAKEDETGRPFVGRAGELLTGILRAIDLRREDVFICNIVKCRPPENRKPLQDEIEACVSFLYRQLEIIGPKVILAMGGTAAETLLNTKQTLAALRNKVHSFRGVPLVVTYHPAALLRNPNWKKPTWDDVRIARQLIDQ